MNNFVSGQHPHIGVLCSCGLQSRPQGLYGRGHDRRLSEVLRACT